MTKYRMWLATYKVRCAIGVISGPHEIKVEARNAKEAWETLHKHWRENEKSEMQILTIRPDVSEEIAS